MELRKKKCVPCEGGIPSLKEPEILSLLKQLKGWESIGDKKIVKSFRFINFKHTVEFVNKVAAIAEQEGHHPDLHVSYGSCRVELWTHAVNGLTENDFILASKIDQL
jgi:4a-hydroxytetrahydrobiopterin dehydratase